MNPKASADKTSATLERFGKGMTWKLNGTNLQTMQRTNTS